MIIINNVDDNKRLNIINSYNKNEENCTGTNIKILQKFKNIKFNIKI